jgi:hypothetical protein
MPAFPRWVIIVSGFVLTVLAYRSAWPWMYSDTGLPGPTVVQATQPTVAAFAVLAATVVAGVIAITISRLITGLTGLVVMGAALGWAGLSLAPMRDVLFHGSAPLVAADGFAWCIVVLILGWLAIGLCSPVADVHPEFRDQPPDPLLSLDGVKMLAAGVAALPIVWLFAQSDLRGQTLAATVLGGVAAGLVGRMWSPHVQPILLPAGVCLAGTLAGWVAAMLLPDAIDRAYTSDGVPGLLMPIPIDWAAGALFGAPIGFHWAGSFLKHEGETAAA